MNGSWFFEQNFNGLSDEDEFFDTLKYLDFPLEDVESNEAIEDWESQFQHLHPPSNLFAEFTIGFGAQNCRERESLKLKKSSILPRAAVASTSRSIPVNYESSERKFSHAFRTSSPVSVLDSSSSSSSAENPSAYHPIPVKRPRSKCPRRRRCTFPFISTLYAPKYHPLGYFESESESYPTEKMLNLAKKRQKKKRNLTLLLSTVEMKKPSSETPGEIRRCTHCQVTKTPQWREGPMGPKTLCNACGVRYRSGRLFPEYRPAASPTFVPTLHSNSHRKVVEMRKNLDSRHVGDMAAMDTALPPVPEYSF